MSPTLQADSLPAELPGKPKNTGVGSLSLLQGIFSMQEWNLSLLHCRWILYQLSYQGSPFILLDNIVYHLGYTILSYIKSYVSYIYYVAQRCSATSPKSHSWYMVESEFASKSPGFIILYYALNDNEDPRFHYWKGVEDKMISNWSETNTPFPPSPIHKPICMHSLLPSLGPSANIYWLPWPRDCCRNWLSVTKGKGHQPLSPQNSLSTSLSWEPPLCQDHARF